MSRTLTAPPTDRSMWRRLLRLVHPDTGGDHDLYIWVDMLREHVAGDMPEPPPSYGQAGYREPPRHYPKTDEKARVEFSHAMDIFHGHEDLTRHAVDMSTELEEPYSYALSLLSDCYPSAPTDTSLRRQEAIGATYKQLAAIGHRLGMSSQERYRWYKVAESIPLSQRHAGHIISRL